MTFLLELYGISTESPPALLPQEADGYNVYTSYTHERAYNFILDLINLLGFPCLPLILVSSQVLPL
jgi:hypothetical protein